MSNSLQLNNALLLLQPEAELWRFSVSGFTTDQASFTQNVIWEDGVAQCTWAEAQPKMEESLATLTAFGISEKRREAYERESDPIFFQEQRGEVEVGTWAASVAAIKAEYPK